MMFIITNGKNEIICLAIEYCCDPNNMQMTFVSKVESYIKSGGKFNSITYSQMYKSNIWIVECKVSQSIR